MRPFLPGSVTVSHPIETARICETGVGAAMTDGGVSEIRRSRTVEFSSHTAPLMSSTVQPSLFSSTPSSVPSESRGHNLAHSVPSTHARVISFSAFASHDSVNDPEGDDSERENAEGDDEVDIVADPSRWRPFSRNSVLLTKDGKTIGFRTRSGFV